MPPAFTQSIGNPHLDEHLQSLQQNGISVQEHNDCGNCNICRYNRIFVLGQRAELPRSPPSTYPGKMARIQLTGRDRSLRLALMWLWIPGFAFLLAHGLMNPSNGVCPALGIIPLTLSFAIGLAHVLGRAKSKAINVLTDAFNACFHIGILIPSWIMLNERTWSYNWNSRQPDDTMIGTYGTTFLIAEFCIHTFFVLREVPWMLRQIKWKTSVSIEDQTCPHCAGDLSARKKGKQPQTRSHGKENYQAVATAEYVAEDEEQQQQEEEEDRGRPSTDDETARLV